MGGTTWLDWFMSIMLSCCGCYCKMCDESAWMDWMTVCGSKVGFRARC